MRRRRSPPACVRSFPGYEIPVGEIGCVLATHTGPKALAIVYIKK